MTKRFWSQATWDAGDTGFRILLDGKLLRLPSGAVLAPRHAALAEAIAAEWQQAGGEKGGSFTQVDVPLTGLAGSAQDRIAPQRAAMVATLARYAESDLLCYRAATPADLAARQTSVWESWLDWATQRYGAPLISTTGIAHIAQPAASLAALHTALDDRSIEHLAAIGLAIPGLGSCVLGLALADNALSPAEAVTIASLDQLYQEQFWGSDPANEERRTELGDELLLAKRFIELTTA